MDLKVVEPIVEKLSKELREDNVAVFVGAGLSRAAGYVDWAGLLAPLAKELGLDSAKEEDLVGVAQFYLNHHRDNRNALNQQLLEAFSDLKQPHENHEILARLPIRSYWTTNYDKLIEKSLGAAGKIVDSKYTVAQLATTKPHRDVILFKMHGDIDHPGDTILTREDYERYHLPQKQGPFITALSGDLVEKTFLFLGFSFSDPNLNYILSRVRIAFAKDQRAHYCVMKRREKLADESGDEFRYAAVRQDLMIEDLKRYNINTILVDNYNEITELLRMWEKRFRLGTVFVSGSAAEYGKWGRDGTEAFLRRLGTELIKRNFRVTTGFGLGVGGALVTGAIQEIYSSPTRTIEEQLVMRPFPIGITDAAERNATFKKYRDEMVSQSGIAIFVLGNKETGGKVIPADGLKAEFEQAAAAGLCLIPIGASGYMSETLWNEVLADPGRYYKADIAKIVPLLKKLGDTSIAPTELLTPLFTLIDILTKE